MIGSSAYLPIGGLGSVFSSIQERILKHKKYFAKKFVQVKKELYYCRSLIT